MEWQFKMLIAKQEQIELDVMNKCNEQQGGKGDVQITAIVRDLCR